ncbi:MAG: CsbD family protein [Undibacterium sp.]|uniref:CsbD family protein n=1 Tax=Undibacterium sp. TaxID=1914977 RepID=UPI0027226E02|nr:CsbD family protein [Undibacterium sp.]MDO8653985.1 CsbD family protein [Undibacterium sp.]
MNKDQATGAAKKLGGKMQEEVGKLVGSKHQQTEGIKHQIAGNIQETVGDLKAAVKQVKKSK